MKHNVAYQNKKEQTVMKKRITAVLLCVALLLTLSVNVSADTLIDETQTTTNTQITPVTDEITVTE